MMRPNWLVDFLLIVTAAAVSGWPQAGGAQGGPTDIIAAKIRGQGYSCDSPQSAERDATASTANEVVWMLRCQNASYRVTLIPNMAAKVEKVESNTNAPASTPGEENTDKAPVFE
jgi:hypothetical protein